MCGQIASAGRAERVRHTFAVIGAAYDYTVVALTMLQCWALAICLASGSASMRVSRASLVCQAICVDKATHTRAAGTMR